MENADEDVDARSEEHRITRERRFQELAHETQNPMYAWLELWPRLTAAMDIHAPGGPEIVEDVTIPAWIANYLFDVANGLVFLSGGINPRADPGNTEMANLASVEEALKASVDPSTIKPHRIEPDAAMKLVTSVMGLTGAGWNAFAALDSVAQRMGEFRLYESIRETGGSAKEALAKVQEVYGNKDERTTLRRVKEGRALAEPQVSKPTPQVSTCQNLGDGFRHYIDAGSLIIDVSYRRRSRRVIEGHSMVNHLQHRPAAGSPVRSPLPMKVPLPQAPMVFGLSRSAIYRAAQDGHITLSKLGRGTLVDTASVIAYLDGLPRLTPKATT